VDGRVWNGRRFKLEREAAGYTTTDLAGMVGVTRQTIRNWEVGKSTPHPRMVGELARVLRVNARTFYSDPEAGSPP
jgi:DNA-binding XRE family transcriptional regulator